MTAWCLCWWLVMAWTADRSREFGPYRTEAACERSAETAMAGDEWHTMEGYGRPSRWTCVRRGT